MKYYDLEERWSKHFKKTTPTSTWGSWLPTTYITTLKTGNQLRLFTQGAIGLYEKQSEECIFYFDGVGTNLNGPGLDSGLYLELL